MVVGWLGTGDVDDGNLVSGDPVPDLLCRLLQPLVAHVFDDKHRTPAVILAPRSLRSVRPLSVTAPRSELMMQTTVFL